MRDANGDVSLVLHVALQRYDPCQMESLGCILGTNTLLMLHTVALDEFQLRRRDRPKYREPW